MNPEHNVVGWFEIYVQDMTRAKAFYETTFQVTLERLDAPEPELWVFPMKRDKSGCAGALVKMTGKDSGPGGTIVYFSCDDCAVEAERAARSGGTIQHPKFAIGDYGFIAYIQDTESNLIGLHSMK